MFKKVLLGLIFASSILSTLTKPSPNNDYGYSQSQAQSIQDQQLLSSSNLGGFGANGSPDGYSFQINSGIIPTAYSQSISSSTFGAPPSPFPSSGGVVPYPMPMPSFPPTSVPQSPYSLSGSPFSVQSSTFPGQSSNFAQTPFSSSSFSSIIPQTFSSSYPPIDYNVQSPFYPAQRPAINNYNDGTFSFSSSSLPSMGYIKQSSSRPFSNLFSGIIPPFGGH